MNAIKLALSALEKAITKTRLHDPKVLQQLMLLKSLLSPFTEGKSMRASDLIESVLAGNDPVNVISEGQPFYSDKDFAKDKKNFYGFLKDGDTATAEHVWNRMASNFNWPGADQSMKKEWQGKMKQDLDAQKKQRGIKGSLHR